MKSCLPTWDAAQKHAYRTRGRKWGALLQLSVLCLSLYCLAAEEPNPNASLNEQVVMLEVEGGLKLETTIYRPNGGGPFPLVVFNHGQDSGSIGMEWMQSRTRAPTFAREFVRRGYLVAMPMRRGFHKSEGRYLGTGCNLTSQGRQSADDIKWALDALTKRPDVDARNIVVAGQSAGGFATIAFTAQYPAYPGVKAAINFAGGQTWTGNGCQWERSLISAFGEYGNTSRIPTLWIYGDNDSFWGPASGIPTESFSAFTGNGGNAVMLAYGSFDGGDAHSLVGKAAGRKVWLRPVMDFLSGTGMPINIKQAE